MYTDPVWIFDLKESSLQRHKIIAQFLHGEFS